MAKQKPAYFNKGKSTMLENVTVKSPKKEIDTRSKAAVSSLPTKAASQYPINNPVPKISQLASPSAAAGPKKLGRFATALSDATSTARGAANMAFGKNVSKTTGGKVLERGARVGAAGLGLGVAKKAAVAGATKAITTAAKAGSVNPIGHGIMTAATVAAGQAMYKNRSAESTRQGLMNPGKGKTNLGINFDKPFSKAGRDYPLSESPNPEFNNQK